MDLNFLFLLYKDLSLKEKVNDSVKEDATYYAKWIPNTYTLKLEVNGKVTEVKGSFNSLKKLEIPESNYKITYDEREVFIKRTFKGWVNENNEPAIENYIFKKGIHINSCRKYSELICIKHCVHLWEIPVLT